jgi:hypothetical protein
MELNVDIDPLKVLNLPKEYNKEMLREAYKRMALKSHPDKGGSEYIFKLVTQCYKYLSAEIKKREADKQFYELKQEFLKHVDSSSSKSSTSRKSNQSSQKEIRHREKNCVDTEQNMRGKLQNIFYSGSKFDQEKFNQFFIDNKLSDEAQETGYKEWMEKAKVKDAPQYKGSFNSQGFNNHFESHAKVQKDHKQIIKYQEPEALVTVNKLGFTELGQNTIDDYSGENKTMKSLNFMDYKIAHTTSRIIDPKTVNRQSFQNIQELERVRENVAYQMNEQELVEYMKRQKLQERLEEKRQQAVRENNYRIEQHYQRLNGLLTMPNK